jgi:dolichyl-phosphate-mannose--protein O-mannosyl transferase
MEVAAASARPATSRAAVWTRVWATVLLVGALAAATRLAGLAHPRDFVFDETHYAKDAWAVLRTGVERVWSEGSNERVLAGDLSGLTNVAAFASHPPAGKWVIAAGQAALGMEPLGWRLGPALLGALAAAVMVLLGLRVTGSLLLGGVAGVLVALDGLAITMSRHALLDGQLMAWLVFGMAALVRDRDALRARLQAGGGLVRWWRPWQLGVGVFLGLACATKVSAAPVLAGFGVLTVVWTAGAAVSAGEPSPRRRAVLLDGPLAFLAIVGTAAVTYLATWVGWFRSTDGYLRTWAADHPASGWGALVPDSLRSLAEYHRLGFDLLADLDADHTWASHPVGWLWQQRPVLLWRDRPGAGEAGCGPDGCVADILALGTSTTWWLGCLAAAACVWWALVRRDWRAWLVLVGVATTWLPWFAFTDRPIFATYAVITLPFLVLAIVVALQRLRDATQAGAFARWLPAVLMVVLLAVTIAQVWFFWPVWTGETLTLEQWRLRVWLRGWA